MEKDCEQDLLRAFIAASLSKKSPSDVEQLLESSNVAALGVGSNANALAYALGDTAKLPERQLRKVEDWLEWEETKLRPALASRNPAGLAQALHQLDIALAGRGQFLGVEPTVADVAIFSTLQNAPSSVQLNPTITDYLKRIQEINGTAEGISNFQAYLRSRGSSATSSSAGESASKSGKKGDKATGPDQGSAVPRSQPEGSTHGIRPKPGNDGPQILPIKGQRNILITSALPYVNNVPHLGNIVGCVLSADCYARFARSRGHNTLYVCGTDEYGTATETKALEEGLTCQEVCDKYHAIHKSVYEWFQISFDKFGRTPTWQQTEICQDMFRRLQAENCILEDTIEQLYSEALGKFLADRFVLGTCPKCGYEHAKGDQCDNCGSMLNPVELINPRCKITGTTPVLRKTKHLFLDLPKLTEKLQQYVDETSELGGWSANCIATTKAWMRDGLKQRCITRDLIWGTPVPQEGYEDKVFYVWFDAPIGYISITANYTDQWKEWWQNPEEVDLVQFMGKDNVPFHTIIFPSSQIGTADKWTKMKNISVTEYLNYEGTKFSKSNGTGVFGTDAKDTGIPVEVWRYYLLSNRPEVSDTDFKWTDLRSRLNSELLANLGNFINRALSFASTKFEGKVPEASVSGSAVEEEVEALRKDVAELTQQYISAMEGIRIREGISKAMAISSRANKFFQDTKPWALIKGDEAQQRDCGTVINVALGVVLLLAGMIEPYMPSVSAKILDQLKLPEKAGNLTDDNLAKAADLSDFVPANHTIGTPEVLFREMRDESEIEALKQRYGGVQQAESSNATASTNGMPAKKGAPKSGKASGAQGKKTANAAGTESSVNKPTSSAESKDAGKAKEKKAKVQPQKAATPTDISAIDLRVGVLTNVRKHENAESLYVEDIECGEEQPRQVVSGLVKHIPIEKMEGRKVVIVANLKAGNMRGVKSHAMVLAASSSDGSKVELVEPPASSKPGDRVFASGFEGEPVAVLKKDVFDTIAGGLKTDDKLVACFNSVALQTKDGACRVESLTQAAIH